SSNLLLSQNSSTSQLRIAVGPDGTLLLQSPITNSLISNQMQKSQQDSLASSQPSPDSTTPSIDLTTSSPSTSVAQSASCSVGLPPPTTAPQSTQSSSQIAESSVVSTKSTGSEIGATVFVSSNSSIFAPKNSLPSS